MEEEAAARVVLEEMEGAKVQVSNGSIWVRSVRLSTGLYAERSWMRFVTLASASVLRLFILLS